MFSSVKTRIQAASSSTKDNKGKGPRTNSSQLSIIKLLVKILNEEGVSGFFKGFGASMLNTFSMREYLSGFIYM